MIDYVLFRLFDLYLPILKTFGMITSNLTSYILSYHPIFDSLKSLLQASVTSHLQPKTSRRRAEQESGTITVHS